MANGPLRGTRTIQVNQVGPGPVILQPFPRDPTIVRAVQTSSGPNGEVTLTGQKVGKTIIDRLTTAPTPGTSAPVVQQLEVSVKAEKIINTAFFYVNDGHSQVATRAIADIDALVTNVNRILIPQANVKIIKKSAASLSISQNLGTVVRFSSHIPGVAASDKTIVFEDSIGHPDADALAHEFVHGMIRLLPSSKISIYGLQSWTGQ